MDDIHVDSVSVNLLTAAADKQSLVRSGHSVTDTILRGLPSRNLCRLESSCRTLDSQGSAYSTRSAHDRRHAFPTMRISSVASRERRHEDHTVDIVDSILSTTCMTDGTARAERRCSEAIRDMAMGMAMKRSVKLRTEARIHRQKRGCFGELKYSTAVKWKRFKEDVNNLLFSAELWRTPLLSVTGKFGSGVHSYFLFLKYILLLNIPTCLLLMTFIFIPHVMHRCTALEQILPSQNLDFTGLELITGGGFLSRTEMYQGVYANGTVQPIPGYNYNMKMSYLLTMVAYYLLCLIVIASSMARSYRKAYIEKDVSTSNAFISKVFAGWDYGVTSSEAALLKQKSIYFSLQELLSRYRTTERRSLLKVVELLVWRVLMTLLSLFLLTCSCYLVHLLQYTKSLQGTNKKLLDGLLIPGCVTLLNQLLPALFTFIARKEGYNSARGGLILTMLRSSTLHALTLGTLMYYWYRDGICDPKKNTRCPSCWEVNVGKNVYQLVIFDFLLSLVITFFTEFMWKVLSSVCCRKTMSPPQFGIVGNALELVHSQTLCWLGAFFCPVLPLIVILKLVMIFYIKKLSAMRNCRPSMNVWSTSRAWAHFMLVFFLGFCTALCSTGVAVFMVKPSQGCGPFRKQQSVYDTVNELVRYLMMTQHWLGTLVSLVTAPGIIAGVLVALCTVVYYAKTLASGKQQVVQLLREQVMMEGRDKTFLLKLLQSIASNDVSAPSWLSCSTSSGHADHTIRSGFIKPTT
ncbi:PREDICTED: transmembrane channel-like protein 7 isoform X2 [Priapulus caudatus]|uniref:Transmembrane channel-like protein 7 isoform X2 n=1 Tax=Priapulus caudatus TaxID=37621 RepID=A0ABM1DUN2_PRICU|nr:PREDICTED: transmembrane channel-like protein 7 isoform X2 [Priapulus caudatus]